MDNMQLTCRYPGQSRGLHGEAVQLIEACIEVVCVGLDHLTLEGINGARYS